MSKMKKMSSVKRVQKQMIWATILLVIASVMMFALIEYFVWEIMDNQEYDPIDAIGMIVPMAIILGFFNSFVLRSANRYFTMLIRGINKITAGDFGVSLDIEKAGNYKEVFENFNKMSKELQGGHTLRDDFISQFSHEINTPVMSIHGFATLMLEEELSVKDQKQYLTIIASESKKLMELSRNNLFLAKLESQHMLMDKRIYLLDEQIKECLIQLEPIWVRKELDLTVELETVRWLGNQEIMEHLWHNLLINAISYTPRRGQVSISLEKDKYSVIIRVKDSGCGIASEDIPKLFNKYFKAKGNSSSRGLGLGLSIVKRIVELCDGEIEVDSLLNEGSEFTVSLPSAE